MSHRLDMTGQKYGRATAVCDVGSMTSGDRKWKFHCDCGLFFEANGFAVRSGKTIDCPTCSAKRAAQAITVHGKTNTAEFGIWTGMQTRCYNPKRVEFKDYGGRGIKICDEWRYSFSSFYADMGPRPSPKHSIERRDNDGNYEPDNCYWATIYEQSVNKRTNVKITIDGVEKTLSQWAKLRGVGVATVSVRYHQGIRGEALFSTTVQLLTHDGITDTVSGWSKRTGIKNTTISMRVNSYNWPVHLALTKGAKL